MLFTCEDGTKYNRELQEQFARHLNTIIPARWRPTRHVKGNGPPTIVFEGRYMGNNVFAHVDWGDRRWIAGVEGRFVGWAYRDCAQAVKNLREKILQDLSREMEKLAENMDVEDGYLFLDLVPERFQNAPDCSHSVGAILSNLGS